MNMKLMQNCPNHIKLPKILTRNRYLKTKRGASVRPPPPPPTPLHNVDFFLSVMKKIIEN